MLQAQCLTIKIKKKLIHRHIVMNLKTLRQRQDRSGAFFDEPQVLSSEGYSLGFYQAGMVLWLDFSEAHKLLV